MPPGRRIRPNKKLVEALKTCRSIGQALDQAGLTPSGGNYATAHRLIKDLDIDTSHMTGQGWNLGGTTSLAMRNIIPLEQILVADSRYMNTSRLRKRLIGSGLKAAICEKCGLAEWNGEKISLELNHINGDRFDNRLLNLELLCPNCHAQTETYRGRNIGNRSR